MNNALHIAGREFAENARTKGFWINLVMFPFILLLCIKVPQLLEEKAKSARHFVVVDQSGEFLDVIDVALERKYQASVMKKLFEYQQEFALPEFKASSAIDADMLENMPAPGMDADPTAAMDPLEGMLDMLAEQSPEMLDMLSKPEGLDLFLKSIYATLIPDPPMFDPPRRMLIRDAVPEGSLDGLDLTTATPTEIVTQLKPYLLDEKPISGTDDPLFALVVIPADAFDQVQRPGLQAMVEDAGKSAEDGVQFWSTNLTDTDLSRLMERTINKEVQRREFLSRDLDPAEVSQVQRTTMQFASFDPKKAEGEEKVSMADTIRKWVPVGFVYLMWTAIMTTVSMLLNNTVEEKSSRIIEVLLSSATPWEIMSGKLIGIAGVGMTMMLGWILSLMGVLKYLAGPEADWANTLFDVIQNGGLLPLFVLYFFSGYLIYSGIFLAIGSLCNTVKEAQNFMGTAMIIMMVPMFTMIFITQDPHGSLATFLTWVPIYTPFVMMNRAAADPPMFDLVWSGVLMFVTAVFMLWLSSRIFRLGVLRTGQPPKLMELVRSLTTPLRNQ